MALAGRYYAVRTVVFIHGGFWRASSKDEMLWVADGFLDQGYSVAVKPAGWRVWDPRMVIQRRQSGADAWAPGGRYPSDSSDAERLFRSRDYECVGISRRRLLQPIAAADLILCRWLLLADTVEKVENRAAPKISRSPTFGCLDRCKPLQDRHEVCGRFYGNQCGPLTSLRVGRTREAEKFVRQPKRAFLTQSAQRASPACG